ncbi:MAG: response regulator [Bacteroidota bacterium]
MNKTSHFIVVDDDQVNNMICRTTIKKVSPMADIQTFNVPEEAFEYISIRYAEKVDLTILFLDINMPGWSGWDFLDNFEILNEQIKKKIQIYMLSSSIDPTDKQRAIENNNVVGYLEKPLSIATVSAILDVQMKINL